LKAVQAAAVKRKPAKVRPSILDIIMNVIESFGAILLAIMTVIILWQIIARTTADEVKQLFNIEIISAWTEEIALILLVWFGMTGIAVGIRKHLHIGVEFVTDLFPQKIRPVFIMIVHIMMVLFSLFLLIIGAKLAWGLKDFMTPATLISRGLYIYSAAPVAALFMLIYSIELIAKQIKGSGGTEV
jgi:TRAP-type C4-dicarboxylate transport system permease small subunit